MLAASLLFAPVRDVRAYGVLMLLRFVPTAALAAVVTFTVSGAATAAVMRLDDSSAFGAGPAQVTFNGLEGFDANGLDVNGLEFTVTGGDGLAVIASLGFPVPITSNNLADPVLTTNFGASPDELTVRFDAPVVAFGFGYAFNASNSDPTAVSISVFAGSDLLDTLSFSSDFDPLLPGGFAGLSSTTPFDRVVIGLTQESSTGFALDNFRTLPRSIPEPSTLALLGIAALAALRRRSML